MVARKASTIQNSSRFWFRRLGDAAVGDLVSQVEHAPCSRHLGNIFLRAQFYDLQKIVLDLREIVDIFLFLFPIIGHDERPSNLKFGKISSYVSNETIIFNSKELTFSFTIMSLRRRV